MKKLLTLLFVLIALTTRAQDVVPTDTSYHALPTYSLKYQTTTHRPWLYKGSKYGSTELATNVEVSGKENYHGIQTIGAKSFNNSTHVFTVAAGGLTYWNHGLKYTTTLAKTCDLDDATLVTNKLYFIYFSDTTGILRVSQTPWNFKLHTMVATVFWNGSEGAIQDEDHNYTRDLDWHLWAHSTIGTRYISGLSLTAPTTGNSAQLSVGAGSIADEDNDVTISPQITMRGWHFANSGVWTYANYSLPYLGTSGTPQYLDTDTYTLTATGAAKYSCYYVYASNDETVPIYVIPSQIAAPYNIIADARAEALPVLQGVHFNPEMKILYKLVYKGDGTFQEYIDYRGSTPLPAGGSSSTTAGSVSFSPYGTITGTTVQKALEEFNDSTFKNLAQYYIPRYNNKDFIKSKIYDNGKVHINGTAPDSMVTVTGGIHATTGLKLDVSTGKAPLTVVSTTKNVNFNSDLFDDRHIDYLARRGYADSTFIPLTQKGANNGVATLDAGGKVPLTQMNDGLLGAVRYQALYNATTNTPALPLASVSKGYYYIIDVGGTVGGIVYNPGDWIISSGLAWGKVDNNNAISSVFGRVGNITATSGDYTADQITETASRVFVSPTEKSNFNTAYGWGNHASAGYGLASALTTHAGLTTTAHGLGASAFHPDSYFQTALTNPVTGSGAGTLNYIPKYTGLYSLGNSVISEGSGYIDIANNVISKPTTNVSMSSQSIDAIILGRTSAGRPKIIFDTSNTTYTNRVWGIENYLGNLIIGRNGLDVIYIENGGNVNINSTLVATGNITAPSLKLSSTTEGYVLKIHSDGTVYPDSPTSGTIYNGSWDASTNTPTLENAVGTTGSYYHCTVSGTVNFGAGNISFTAYTDDVAYNGSIWQKIPQAQYSPVIATASNLGVVKIGSGVSVDGNGIISVSTAYDASGAATTAISGHESTYNHTNYNTAYTDRLKWDGGSTGLVAATGRTSLGLGSAALAATTDFYASNNPSNYITAASLPTVNDATLTIDVTANRGLSLSATPTFTANASADKTITITSNATTSNTAGTIVLRDGSGNVSLTGSFCSSDTTLKRNIKPFSKVDLYNASKIDFIKFLFKDDKTNWQHYGVAYQQVKELLPSVTKVNEETGKGEVNYTEMLILIVAQQKEAIEKLTKRVEQLEEKTKVGCDLGVVIVGNSNIFNDSKINYLPK